MNKLVKNLLTLNHLEEGRDEVKMERFDIVSLIKGVLQSMDIMIQQKEAKVSFEAEEPVYVWQMNSGLKRLSPIIQVMR